MLSSSIDFDFSLDKTLQEIVGNSNSSMGGLGLGERTIDSLINELDDLQLDRLEQNRSTSTAAQHDNRGVDINGRKRRSEDVGHLSNNRDPFSIDNLKNMLEGITADIDDSQGANQQVGDSKDNHRKASSPKKTARFDKLSTFMGEELPSMDSTFLLGEFAVLEDQHTKHSTTKHDLDTGISNELDGIGDLYWDEEVGELRPKKRTTAALTATHKQDHGKEASAKTLQQQKDEFREFCMQQLRQITRLSQEQLLVDDMLADTKPEASLAQLMEGVGMSEGGANSAGKSIDITKLQGYPLWSVLYWRQEERVRGLKRACEEKCRLMEAHIALLEAKLTELTSNSKKQGSTTSSIPANAWDQTIEYRLRVLNSELGPLQN